MPIKHLKKITNHLISTVKEAGKNVQSLGTARKARYTDFEMTATAGYSHTKIKTGGKISFTPAKGKYTGEVFYRWRTEKSKPVALVVTKIDAPQHLKELLLAMAKVAAETGVTKLEGTYASIKSIHEQTKLFGLEQTNLEDENGKDISHDEAFKKANRLETLHVTVTSDISVFINENKWVETKPKKAVKKTATAKKTTTKKAAAKSTTKASPTKKTTVKKPATTKKTTTAKSATPKKAAPTAAKSTTKASTKKTTVKKPATTKKTTTAKSATPKKAAPTAAKSTTKASTKKTTAKKAPATKKTTTAKSATPKKAAPTAAKSTTKASTKKTTAKKAPATKKTTTKKK